MLKGTNTLYQSICSPLIQRLLINRLNLSLVCYVISFGFKIEPPYVLFIFLSIPLTLAVTLLSLSAFIFSSKFLSFSTSSDSSLICWPSSRSSLPKSSYSRIFTGAPGLKVLTHSYSFKTSRQTISPLRPRFQFLIPSTTRSWLSPLMATVASSRFTLETLSRP